MKEHELKNFLIDVLRQTAPLFDKIRIDGSDTGTVVEAYTEDKMLFLFAKLKDIVPQFAGEFGISNLQLLRGLLDFPSYKTETAKFHARRIARDGTEFVSELEFTDANGGHARFKTINPKMAGARAQIVSVDWGISVTPSKAKLTEVMQLTGMLAQVDQHFSVSYENRNVLLTIGGKGAASHSAVVALATDVDAGPLPAEMVFRAPHFLQVLKNAGNSPCTIRFAKEGIAGILIETEHGAYSYILRGTEG